MSRGVLEDSSSKHSGKGEEEQTESKILVRSGKGCTLVQDRKGGNNVLVNQE
jgi:hypothetical protein